MPGSKPKKTELARFKALSDLGLTANQVGKRTGRDPKTVLSIAHSAGAHLGLIGFGRIGRALIRKLSGFGMNFLVYDPYLDGPTIQEAGANKVELETLLEQSRFVLLVCPLTKETEDLIGENELRKMRSDAILINCARGPIVRE